MVDVLARKVSTVGAIASAVSHDAAEPALVLIESLLEGLTSAVRRWKRAQSDDRPAYCCRRALALRGM